MTLTLMFTPAKVCYNCLNGFHSGCGLRQYCQCKEDGHKQWWFRRDGIKDEQAARRADGLA